MRTLLAAMFLALSTTARAERQPYVHESTVPGLLEPADVGFDSEGRLLIAAGREGLIRIEPDGTRTTLAAGRCVRLPGRAVTADPARHRVLVASESGERLVDGAAWPIGRLLAPEAAGYAADGSLWIADTGNARVVRVDRDGDAVAFGERGFFPGQFVAPSGIAFDEGGPLVTDRLNHRVTRLGWDGTMRDLFGLHAIRPREGEGRIHYPRAIAVDPGTGRVAVAEPFERRVQVFRRPAEGEPPRPMPPLPSKDGVNSHFGPGCSVGGTIVASWEPESGCVVLWDTRRDPPAHVATFGGTGDRPGLFRAPTAVLVEPDGGAVWVLDALGDRLERWTLARDPADPVQYDPFMPRLSVGIPLTVARSEAGLREIAASDLLWSDGRVGVAFVDGSVAWTDPSMATFKADGRRARPRNDGDSLRAAAIDAKGRLLLLWGNGIEVRDGREPSLVPLTRVARDPRGLGEFGGTLVVSDADADSIVRVNRAGEPGEPLVARRPAESRFDGAKAAEDGALWIPMRMAVGPGGELFVVDYGNHRLQRFGTDGVWQSTFTLSRSRAREKSAPSEVPSPSEIERASARRDEARARTRAGSGRLAIVGGGTLDWKTSAPIPRGEPFAIEVCVTDADGKPAEELSIGVDCTMPHHGHGMNVRPEIRVVGPGHWIAEPMLLHMPGRWELGFDLSGADGRARRVQTTLEVE